MQYSIGQEELDEVVEDITNIVKATRMAAFIIGDFETSMIYSIVFGNTEAAAGALESLGIAGATILSVIALEGTALKGYIDGEEYEDSDGHTLH